ncbi:unnamed protein product, partial [Phaeothamnion confervicola]
MNHPVHRLWVEEVKLTNKPYFTTLRKVKLELRAREIVATDQWSSEHRLKLSHMDVGYGDQFKKEVWFSCPGKRLIVKREGNIAKVEEFMTHVKQAVALVGTAGSQRAKKATQSGSSTGWIGSSWSHGAPPGMESAKQLKLSKAVRANVAQSNGSGTFKATGVFGANELGSPKP